MPLFVQSASPSLYHLRPSIPGTRGSLQPGLSPKYCWIEPLSRYTSVVISLAQQVKQQLISQIRPLG